VSGLMRANRAKRKEKEAWGYMVRGGGAKREEPVTQRKGFEIAREKHALSSHQHPTERREPLARGHRKMNRDKMPV